MARKYKIIINNPIKKFSKEEIEKIIKPYVKESIKTGDNSNVDTTKSGKEWAEICRLIKKGKTKEQIFKEMNCFKKWTEAPQQYKEHTYKKAVGKSEEKKKLRKSTYTKEQLDILQDVDFKAFCNYVIGKIMSSNKEDRKEGEGAIVQHLLNKNRFITPEDSKEIHVYNEGIYVYNGEAFISKVVQKILKIFNSIHITNEIVAHIKRTTFIKREKFQEPEHLICLQNGILNIKTMKVEEFTPDIIFLNKIAPKYNPAADCPKIKKFIREVIIKREDWDNKGADISDIQTLQEYCGYLLYKKIIFNRAVMLYGEGENGKSTFINVIKKFLGSQNISNVSIQKLEKNNFATSALYGKLANLHSDLPKTSLRETSKFKQLTGGDSVDAEKKYRDTFSFLPYCKMMFAANTLPATYDDTKAFWRRWLIFLFPNSFEENKEGTNKDLLSELTTEEELSGFLNWCVEGLKRLLKNKKFTHNKSTDEVREEYIRQSDSIGAFILDRVQECAGHYIIKQELYESYISYCRERGYDGVTDSVFHRRFHQKVNVREYHPSGKGGKQRSAWTGVKLKNVQTSLTENNQESLGEYVGEDESEDEEEMSHRECF
jgi:P4 family phage/plasmid primase-like protien